MTSPLCLLPVKLDIPRSVKSHRYYLEAAVVAGVLGNEGKNDTHGGVIGTANSQRAELYGWHNPVSTHMDNIGESRYMYAGVIARGRMSAVACIDPESGIVIRVHPEIGDVFRLDDSFPHWTEGGGCSIAVFTGSYDRPCDVDALYLLQRGVNRLANGVRTAPRVSSGFRVLGDDECFATNDMTNVHLVSRKLAEKRGWLIAECGCGKPADTVDRVWPIDSHGNDCRECRDMMRVRYGP